MNSLGSNVQFVHMAHYTEISTHASSLEVKRIMGISDIEALTIAGYGSLLVEAARQQSRFGRVRVGLYAGDLAVKKRKIVVAQIASGVNIKELQLRFADIFDLKEKAVKETDLVSDIWTGTENATLNVRSALYVSKLPGMRDLVLESATMPDAHYMEFDTWRDCMVTSPATDATSLMLNMTPLVEMEAKNTSH